MRTTAYTGQGTGTLRSTFTSVHPYLRFEAHDRLSLWGILGYGTGDVTLFVDGAGRWTVDTVMRMAEAGARGVLVPAPETGGFELAVRSDTQLVRMTSKAAAGKADKLAAAKAKTNRLRLVLEGERHFELEGDSTLTPSLEAGLRYDGGNAETRADIEIGGSVRYADPARGLTIDAKARGLLVHEDADYTEWSASASVRLNPDTSGRGFSFTLTPAFGTATSGEAEQLWGLRDARGQVGWRRRLSTALRPSAGLADDPLCGSDILGGRRARLAHRLALDVRAGHHARCGGHAA